MLRPPGTFVSTFGREFHCTVHCRRSGCTGAPATVRGRLGMSPPRLVIRAALLCTPLLLSLGLGGGSTVPAAGAQSAGSLQATVSAARAKESRLSSGAA